MDELLITAFVRMLHERLISLKRLPNEYCGVYKDEYAQRQCESCANRPWWEIEFENVGLVKIGWRKRVIVIDWSKTGHIFDPSDITEADVTKGDTYVHAYGYSAALEYTKTLIGRVRMAKRDETRLLAEAAQERLMRGELGDSE